MRTCRCSIPVVAAAMVALSVGASHALAQPVGPPGRIYRLRPASDLQEGCFDPCACPLFLPVDLRGRFVLTRAAPDPLFTNFRVSEVAFRAPQIARSYSGGGTYRIGGEVALVQQMQLDLSANGAATQHFDSGVVIAMGPVPRWPRIDLTLSRNNLFCFDTALHVVASPIADWNDSGQIGVGDIFQFLEDYFSGEADADGNGITSVEDLFTFLGQFFEPA